VHGVDPLMSSHPLPRGNPRQSLAGSRRRKTPLFRSAAGKTGRLTENRCKRIDANLAIGLIAAPRRVAPTFYKARTRSPGGPAGLPLAAPTARPQRRSQDLCRGCASLSTSSRHPRADATTVPRAVDARLRHQVHRRSLERARARKKNARPARDRGFRRCCRHSLMAGVSLRRHRMSGPRNTSVGRMRPEHSGPVQ